MGEVIRDPMGRVLDYIRISVTDRCNFRCTYCMPEGGIEWIPHNRILSYEDILFLCLVLSEMGVKRIRFTGGEPFVRKGFVPFLAEVRESLPDMRIAVTTNGSMLEEWAREIASMNLDSLNVSLDTLDREKFRQSTRTGDLDSVIRGIDSVLNEGVKAVKINAVIMRSLNLDEIPSLLDFAAGCGMLLRLIEFMPLDDDVWSRTQFVSAEEMLDKLPDRALWEALPGSGSTSCGPSRYFKNKETGRIIGIIPAVSNHFCRLCNRLRISSTGEVLPCLFSTSGVPLGEALRLRDRVRVKAAILEAAASKPAGATSVPGGEKPDKTGVHRHMSRIGG